MTRIIYGNPQRDKAEEVAKNMREARALIDATCGMRPDMILTLNPTTKRLNCRNCGAPWEPHQCSYCRSFTA